MKARIFVVGALAIVAAMIPTAMAQAQDYNPATIHGTPSLASDPRPQKFPEIESVEVIAPESTAPAASIYLGDHLAVRNEPCAGEKAYWYLGDPGRFQPQRLCPTEAAQQKSVRFLTNADNPDGAPGGVVFRNLPNGFRQDDKWKLKATATAAEVVLTWTQAVVPPPPAGQAVQCPNGATADPVTSNAIYRATTSGGEGNNPISVSTAPEVTFTDATVVAGTTYYYQVTATNCAAESPKSAELIVVVPAASSPAVPPNAPTNLTAPTITKNMNAAPPIYAVQFSWNPPTRNTDGTIITAPIYYDVYRDISGTLQYTKQNPTPLVALSYFDDTVALGKEYTYQVTAWTLVGGESARSTKTVSPIIK